MFDLTHVAATSLTLVDGLLAGLFFGSSLVEHAARLLAPAPWISYKHAKESVFAPILPPVFLFCLLATCAAVFLARKSVLLGIAAGLLIGALAITAIIHLPLNALFQSWTSEDYPVTWDSRREQWRNWNWVRTLMVVLAYAFVLKALS